MRNKVVVTAFAAMLGLASSVATAQTPKDVTVQISGTGSHIITAVVGAPYGSSGGGGWTATVSGLGAAQGNSIEALTVYCFDPERFFSYNTSMDYTLLSFSDFVANAGVTSGQRSQNWNQVDLTDLNSMAALAASYSLGNPGSVNNPIQKAIWDIGTGAANGTFNSDLSSNWMVLVDRTAWKNGSSTDKIYGTQSFLVSMPASNQIVPEPSTYALMAAGLIALGVVTRRRKAVA